MATDPKPDTKRLGRAMVKSICSMFGHKLIYMLMVKGQVYKCSRCGNRYTLHRADTHSAYRSAETGRYVTEHQADAHPDTTVQEHQ